MHKLDPRLKHWTKRWFVLRGKELKYYRSKVCESVGVLRVLMREGGKRNIIVLFQEHSCNPKGVVNLGAWCRITRHELTSSFQVSCSRFVVLMID